MVALLSCYAVGWELTEPTELRQRHAEVEARGLTSEAQRLVAPYFEPSQWLCLSTLQRCGLVVSHSMTDIESLDEDISTEADMTWAPSCSSMRSLP